MSAGNGRVSSRALGGVCRDWSGPVARKGQEMATWESNGDPNRRGGFPSAFAMELAADTPGR